MNERTLSRTLFLLGIFLLTLASPCPLFAQAESPTPNESMRLDHRLTHARRVRITTPSGKVVAEGVRASAEGLTYRNILSTTGGDTLPNPGHIAWDAVVRVEVPSNHAVIAGLGTGLVVGALTGGAIYSAGQQGDDIGGGGIILLAVPVLAVLGAGVGAFIPSWHPIYRRRRDSARGR